MMGQAAWSKYVKEKIALWKWALRGRNYRFRIVHHSSIGSEHTYKVEGKHLFGGWHECFSVRFTDKEKAAQYIRDMKERWIYNPPAEPPYQRIFYRSSNGRKL